MKISITVKVHYVCSMDIIEERLHLTRGAMMLLAILLGCDYLPGGVHGVGKDTALRFLKDIYASGDRDPTQRFVLLLMVCEPKATL